MNTTGKRDRNFVPVKSIRYKGHKDTQIWDNDRKCWIWHDSNKPVHEKDSKQVKEVLPTNPS